MKSLKRKSLTALATAFAVSTLLAGCGNNDNSGANGNANSSGANAATKETNEAKDNAANNSSTNEAAASNGSDASKLEPYTIKWFVPGAAAQKDQEMVNEEVSNYLKDKINASFDLEVIDWGSWDDKMNLKFASSEPFDLLYTANWNGFTTKISQGNIIDMTDLIDQYAQEAKGVIEPALLEGSKVNGKNFGMPTNKEMATQWGIMLRKDLVDKYKIDITTIKTLEDLEPYYDMIEENEPGVTPFYLNKDISLLNVWNSNHFDHYDGAAGTLPLGQSDFKLINGLETPEAKAGYDLIHKWYQKGYVNKDAATLQDLSGGLKAGKAFAYPEQLKPGKDAEVSTQTGVKWVQVELTQPIIGTGDTQGAMTSISRTSKDPARAMMFLNLLYTDKYLVNLIAFGIEGKHFKKAGENTIDFADGITAQTSGYNLNQPWLFGNQFNDYLWTNEDPQKWQKFKDFNKAAKNDALLGFVFDPTNVKTETAAIANVGKEFNSGLNTGTLDPNVYLPKYIDKLKATGIDKVIVEEQKQLDAWRAAKGQ
ncbi:ABC transporter substrate-binding protein [Paenibacillus sp. OV219]|uniref:ABC transporter substrate-binding protein n=1 Tax=Paenibacillus sp. OV219 TaxID=1884377 RepID=UPI0008D87AB4|nr:ABC transporter substrate-binding protein [Paenibacillus sp. OV219]SEO65195.1 carbohydrate ABC transporter substrate-binding protein, CUT1 family [Paenibacillus sp. OV219]